VFDLDPVVSFLASDPAIIQNLRTRHVPDRFGGCLGCPPGTPLGRCQYLRWATEAETRRGDHGGSGR
jgi:hypothetical protein